MEITHLTYSSLKEAKEDRPTNPFKIFTESPRGVIYATIVGFAQDELEQAQTIVENESLWNDVFRLAEISHAHHLFDLFGFDPLGMGPENPNAPKFLKDYFKAFEPRPVEDGPTLIGNWDELDDYEPLNEQIYDCFSKGSKCSLKDLKDLLVNIYNEGKEDGWLERANSKEAIEEDDEMEIDDFQYRDFIL